MDGPADITPAATELARLSRRIGALALVAGLVTGCGAADGDGGGAADARYGAPARSSSPVTPGSTTTTRDAGATAGDATTAPGTTDDEAAEELVIVIEDFAYTVPESVPPGAEIVVRNLDGVGHTVTADEGDTFDVAVGPGEEVTLTAPSGTGEHPFHCIPHPAMTGTLVVEEGS